jgi:N6-L-threonylcarbamoyladenine synthase
MPSVQRRLNRHQRIIDKLMSICPVTECIIECASFDIQKINNPEIKGRGYQEGDLMGYRNVKSYLFARESCTCQYCGKKITQGQKSHVHHIIPRSQGGTDAPSNLALLHESCHEKLHKNNDLDKLKKNKQYKAETCMNVLRKRLLERFPNAVETFGYVTSVRRNELGLEKSHANDAFVIAGGTNQDKSTVLHLVERAKNNRSLQIQKKGMQPSIRRRRYPIQSGDLVWDGKEKYISKGTKDLGRYVYVMIDGKKTSLPAKKITKVYHFGTIGIET